ncbi:phage tail assembly protein [Azohydromonas lata]|uniref:Phage tail assembly protein n=1 Tax=Azohydromonas lata TaxID=45677 RepID=A0ABU5IE98_9BURK|nr:phage tail assembly protein [Azohydromonas lata]MDZ5456990.1 phage tail assembly protein [Azohydromonas lata]
MSIDATLSKPITLDTPVQRGETKITEIQVRKPNAGELRGVQLVPLMNMDVTALQTVLPRVTVPPLLAPEVQRMDAADLVQLGTEVVAFLLPKAARPAESPTE